MYGSHAGLSYGLVAFAGLVVIALAFLASPLIAVIIAVVAAPVLFFFMSRMRQRSAAGDEAERDAEGRQGGGAQERMTEPARGKSGGAPVSGEGQSS
jgi:uncharacterized membrane protein